MAKNIHNIDTRFRRMAEAVQALCQLGASVTMPDDRNRTCIEIAAYQAVHPKYKRQVIRYMDNILMMLMVVMLVGQRWLSRLRACAGARGDASMGT